MAASSSTCSTRNPILLRPNLLLLLIPPPHNTNNRKLKTINTNIDLIIRYHPQMIPRCSSLAGGDVFSVTSSSSSKHDVDYLGQSTKGDLLLNSGIDGQASLEGPIEEVARMEAQEAEDLLNDLGISSPFSSRNSPRGIFCSRTLNFRSISAIGYDMDYTLMHYNVMAWEGRAYDYCMDNLKNMGFPVGGLAFDPDLVIRGLVIDKEKGNLVKADRFGYVKRAMHGTRMLSNRAVSEMYGRELVDLRKENRWEFLNTLFSVSEAVAYMQMVDKLDEGAIDPDLGPLDYKGLYKAVRKALFRAHVEGQLKNEIMSKPEQFVEPDPELPLALLDQKEAGKRLLLITNSDYHYTDKMMQHSFDRFLPIEMGWRDLFDMEVDINKEPNHQQLKEKVRKELVEAKGERSQQLDLIDAIQRLGVAYHFETEIEMRLHHIYETYGDKNDEDLYTMSLRFRLLRQQGYPVSCDVFNKLKDKEGKFKKSLIGDVRGLLSLHEATHLRVHGEDILDEALEFTTTQLKSALPNLTNNPIEAQVAHALIENQPIHKGLTRLESRHFISCYEQDDSHNKVLLDFAKLDFNLLQKLHQRELSEFTRWWKELDVARNFAFARDRVVELYFWILGVYYEPQYFPAIRILTKVICLISIIDDMYDASNATIEELVLFDDAIHRWEASALDQLRPDYMKLLYQKLLDTYNWIDDEMAKQGLSYRVEYAKSAVKGLVRAYLTEAKWYHEGHIPSLEDHMPVGYLTSGLQPLSTVSFVGMGELATKEAFDWIFSNPLIVHASSAIGRLMNDVVGHEFEQERGHVASAVECYMKQYGATKEEAIDEIEKRVTNAWKDINSECLRPTAVPMPLLLRVLNLARTFHVVYKDGADSYTRSGTKFKEFVTSVLVDAVPI